MKSLTQQEISAVMEQSDPMLRAAILIGWRHGMRISEVTGLLWSDVNLSERTITVRRLKNSLTTTQPLSQAEVDALSGLDRRGRRVFPISRITLHRWFKEAAIAAGIPASKCHFHTVKHSLGYALANANVSAFIIKQALGHRSISSSAVYSIPSEEAVGQAVLAVIGA